MTREREMVYWKEDREKSLIVSDITFSFYSSRFLHRYNRILKTSIGVKGVVVFFILRGTSHTRDHTILSEHHSHVNKTYLIDELKKKLI